MTLFTVFAVLITATALLSYLNERFLRLPPTIGVMAAALAVSIVLTVAGMLGLGVERWAETLLLQVDFNYVLMQGMLSFLLFAGALHVDLGELLERRWTILSLATFGVILSTFLVGTLLYYVLALLDLRIPYVYALLFGALISPTDPIAVLGLLKSAGAPRSLESIIVGESLFNDGVGVVVFTLILGFLQAGQRFSVVAVGTLFLEEAVGGVVLGLVLGYLAYRMIRTVDNHIVETLITLALVAGGYALAGALHTSGPIAMVVAGLFIGNHGRLFGMSQSTRDYLDTFWELLDDILNAMLFVLVGFEVLILRLDPLFLLAGVVAIPLVLAVRFICVWSPLAALRKLRTYGRHAVALVTWAGVRGGIAIALALSLPRTSHRDLILVVTYTVVIFSILVQGLTVGRAVRWFRRANNM